MDGEGELEALRAEVATLRSALAAIERQLADRPGNPVVEQDIRAVSRRGVIGLLPTAALVGATGIGAAVWAATPAAADPGDPLLLGDDNVAGATTTTLSTLRTDGAPGNGLQLQIGNGTVQIDGGAIGYDDVGLGDPALVVSASSPGPGITMTMTTPESAFPSDFANAVGLAVSVDQSAVGASVSSHAGPGMKVQTLAASGTADALSATTAGHGRAVYAVSTSGSNARGTVTALNHGQGPALYGQVLGHAATGAAVVGVAASRGRGGRFSGGAAAVTLMPTTATTHPASGSPGDLVVDRDHRLWFCKGGTQWRQLA